MSRSLNVILWYIKFYKIFNFILLPIIKLFKKSLFVHGQHTLSRVIALFSE